VLVAVALSGGVDSAVAAHLVAKQGHRVVALTMWVLVDQDLEAARRVARQLGVPHRVVDLRVPFEREVMEPFCREYLEGRTPNPCLTCNRRLKFGHLLEAARQLGAQRLATGHYVRVEFDGQRRRWLLRKGRDPNRDQSYFLYGLDQGQLARALFPVGELTKEEVRQLARSLGLEAADSPESREVCFVSGGDYAVFIGGRYPQALEPGPILDTSGRFLGWHRGIARYTVGQRKGLGLAARRRLYVVAIRGKAIIVGPERELLRRELLATEANYIPFERPPGALCVCARVRYQHQEQEATLEPRGEREFLIRFRHPQRAIAPGQAVVCYQGDLVVGGGTIQNPTGTAALDNVGVSGHW